MPPAFELHRLINFHRGLFASPILGQALCHRPSRFIDRQCLSEGGSGETTGLPRLNRPQRRTEQVLPSDQVTSFFLPQLRLSSGPSQPDFTSTTKAQMQKTRDVVDRLRDPPQITAFIKLQQQRARQRLQSQRPQAALPAFFAAMDTLLKSAGHRMNCIHFAAIITATA